MSSLIKNLLCSVLSLPVLAFIWIYTDGFTRETANVSPGKPEEFALFTMPKTGTHLLRPLLENLTDKKSISYWCQEVDCPKTYLYDKNLTNLLMLLPNVLQPYWLNQPIPSKTFISVLNNLEYSDGFLVTHAPFSTEMEKICKERKCVVFFLIRDPRDWVISVIKHPPISGIDIYGAPIGDNHFQSLDFNKKIDYIIKGTEWYYSCLEVFNLFLGWKNSSVCCPLRFEALLGPRGGYTEQEQLVELRKIPQALHLDVSDDRLLEAFKMSFGKGTVFVKGKAGNWKESFTEGQKNLFKEHLGDVLIELGYENDYNW